MLQKKRRISYNFHLDILYIEKIAVSLPRDMITIWQVNI